MSQVGYLIAKIKYVFGGKNPEIINDYFRKQGVRIGNRTHIFSNISNGEPYLISIGDDVTISNNVSFITHDSSISKALPEFTDVFGEIQIDNNCFIGMNTVILPGVHICDNTIIAAGAVITKSIKEPGNVWGGVPARKIDTVQSFAEHYREFAVEMRKVTTNRKEFIEECRKVVK